MAIAEAANDRSGRANVAVSRQDDRTLVVAFDGRWTLGAALPPLPGLLSQIASPGVASRELDRVVLDGRGLDDWDSQFLVYLRKLTGELEHRGLTADPSGLPDGVRRLLALAAAMPATTGARHTPQPAALPDRVELAMQDAARSAVAFVEFIGQVTIALGRMLIGRARFRLSDLMLIIQSCSTKALPIVSLIAVLVGLIMAFVGAVQLRKFGAGIYVADLVSIAMLREMGAVMTAIIMAGRTGAAFAAELGTMQVNEEIDALATLGINPIEYLVLPRVLALVLMMPLLCLYADFMGIVGGAVIGVTLVDVPFLEYWHQTVRSLSLTHLAIGLVKAGVFGALVAVAGCLRGMEAGRSAAAVGMATTSAVVTAIVLIITVDGIFAVVLDLLGL